jgi:BirA family transcriptional regulator, biotin operon repressor / biotin---[acetyl-CoA-carboxylase] ligase
MDGRLLENNPQWLHLLEQTPSTNSWAIEHPTQLQHGDVVFTRHQTAGRGQGDHRWHSPPGVLTASFILDGIAVGHWPALSLASGLATIYAIEDLLPTCQGVIQLKWPNDLWVDRKKLAGILAEGSGQRVVVGIGCNRQANFTDWSAGAAGQPPISLHQIQAAVPSELLLLERLRHYLLEVAGLLMANSEQGLCPLWPALRQRDALLGHTVTITVPHQPDWSGTALGIDPQGCYQIQGSTGEIRSFASGRLRPLVASAI